MTRTRVLTTQKQIKHLQTEIERITAEFHFGGLKASAEKLWEARQPIEDVQEMLRQVIADMDTEGRPR